MARLDEYLFGYREGTVDRADLPKLGAILLRLGVSASLYPCGKFRVKEADKSRIARALGGRIRYEVGEPRGVLGFILRNKSRYGTFLAIILVLTLFLITRTLVWDIRIDGNEVLAETQIEDALAEVGFTVGASWRRMDKSLAESSLLASHPEIAWISLNRRGTVAYVELIESENVGKKEEIYPLYSNVIADRDGVIEEITVSSGEAVVKVGDVVRAGDVLISGVIESSSGVILTRAVGEVRARCATDIGVEIEREATVKEPIKRRLAHARVILFNFSINIFKNYGNCRNTCDIIEEIREFALFGRYRLPITLVRCYRQDYSEVVYERTDAEMILEAKRELDGKMRDMFRDADVIKLRTDGELLDGIYRLTTGVVYVTDIGIESAIEIN